MPGIETCSKMIQSKFKEPRKPPLIKKPKSIPETDKLNGFKGFWSEDENSRLIELLGKFGPKWSLISKKLPSRSP